MQALSYYIALPFIYLISLLPFPVLFAVSDLMYFMLYRVLGYRKDVVMQNLRNSFPEKSEEELGKICRQFYHNLCDFTLETLKILTISRKGIVKHCSFTPEAFATFEKYANEGKSVIMVLGHLGNWEWAGHPFSILCKAKLVVIYHPLKNKYFDDLMLGMRSRNGTRMIPMKTAFKDMLAHRKEVTCTVFLADQTPMPEGAHWMTFLNQDTPVFKGTEVIAKKLNLPIVFAWMTKPKRGYYLMHAETLVEDPAATAEGEITELHTRRLEKEIRANPSLWLWSHRRWKHKRPVANADDKQA